MTVIKGQRQVALPFLFALLLAAQNFQEFPSAVRRNGFKPETNPPPKTHASQDIPGIIATVPGLGRTAALKKGENLT